MWALMWDHEVVDPGGEHVWERWSMFIEHVLAYHPSGVDVILGNDQSTVAMNLPYRELRVVRIG